jgi:flagellar motor switch protein FliN/FliY
MTTLQLTADESDLALAAATAAASVLPAHEQVTPAAPQAGGAAVIAPFAAAVVADLDGRVPGRIALLVGPDLAGAMEQSPLGGLDLAAALQPTVDAVAAALGGRAGAARGTELTLAVADLGGPFTAVPLVGSGFAAAVLVPDTTLRVAVRAVSDQASPTGGAATGAQAPLGTVLGGQPAADPYRGQASTGTSPRRGIELLHGVDMEVTVEIGRTRMTVRDLLELSPGAVLELDRAAGSPADLLVNGRLIARGEVVVLDEDFGLRITEIVTDAATG